MIATRRVLLALSAACLLLAACGNDDADTLDRADDALAQVQRGEFAVGMSARAGEAEGVTAGPVGFTVEGRFDLATGTPYPVLDVTYTRLLGDEKQVVTLRSDGNRMVLVTDGTPVEVPAEQARSLQLAGGDRPVGLGELGVGGWVTEPTESPGPTVDGVATRRITGPVDAADLMSDLALLASQLSNRADTRPLDEEAAKRVQSRVRSGGVEILVDDDDLPRRVRATVGFGSVVAPELRQALGPYAAANLEVTLEVRAPGSPVTPPSLP